MRFMSGLGIILIISSLTGIVWFHLDSYEKNIQKIFPDASRLIDTYIERTAALKQIVQNPSTLREKQLALDLLNSYQQNVTFSLLLPAGMINLFLWLWFSVGWFCLAISFSTRMWIRITDKTTAGKTL